MRNVLTAIMSSALLLGLSGTGHGRDVVAPAQGAGADARVWHGGACKSARLAQASIHPAVRVPFRIRVAYFGP